jgi:hypothetical protein
MKRNTLNVVIDTGAFVLIVLLGASGAVIRYVLPPGSHSKSLWGYGRHEWGGAHFWISVALLALVVLHLVLHWTWVLCMTRGPASAPGRWRSAVAVIALFGLGALAAAPFLSRVQTQAGGGGEEHGGRAGAGPAGAERGAGTEAGNLGIRGSTTLAEAAVAVGMSAADLLKALGLPANTDLQERLGPFGREHGFTPEEVRKLHPASKPSAAPQPAP